MLDVSKIFDENFDVIKNKVKNICEIFDIDFLKIEIWLQQNKAMQFNEAERYFNVINTDIYGKYVAGTLLDFELTSWGNVLKKWCDMWVELLREFWKVNRQKNVA